MSEIPRIANTTSLFKSAFFWFSQIFS